ncbi:MAG TPA: ABC-F family ATP-binding cassette domain-containing protein [Verrucomicrobiae bacterium]
MLTVAGLQKAFGPRLLFDEVSLTLMPGDRVGLVGPNGAGKSTLLKIILGLETPDAGEVTCVRGTRLGYLPQESEPGGQETVLDLAVPHDPHHQTDGQTLARAKQILASLGFRQTDFERPAGELSGGWVMRARLARLLVEEPDVLMLDEPTNHLDLETLLWVQDFLRGYRGALLLISHDREFLNRLCTHIAELRQARLLRYTGNYDDYLRQRESTEATLAATQKAQLREIERLQTFVDRFRAKNTKATQAQSKLKQIERLKEELVEAPSGPEATVGFSFPQPERSGQRVITLENVQFAYGETRVYHDLNFAVERGQRVVLVGPNGAGKSTLLKLLAGVLEPQAGERKLGYNVNYGYYAQHRVAMFGASHSVLEEALDTPRRVGEQFVRSVLGSFLFRGDDVFKPVGVLSGGEKSRLALVKLLLNPPNLLLMDEPTTHLDLASVEALIEALEPYEGTLVFISHDVHFIRAIANHVVRVQAGQLWHFPGGYDYYLHKTAQRARDGLTSGGATRPTGETVARTELDEDKPSPRNERKEQKRLAAEQRQARSRQRRELAHRVHALETEISTLEAREQELVRELESPEAYRTPGRVVEINDELREIHARLPAANAEWETVAGELAQLDSSTSSGVDMSGGGPATTPRP